MANRLTDAILQNAVREIRKMTGMPLDMTHAGSHFGLVLLHMDTSHEEILIGLTRTEVLAALSALRVFLWAKKRKRPSFATPLATVRRKDGAILYAGRWI